MEKLLSSTGSILSMVTGAIVAPVFYFLYGDTELVKAVVTALLFFIALDWISGVRAAKKDKTYVSKYGIDGVFRTFFILLLPAGGHLLDNIFGAPDVLFGILSFGVLYHTIQSMTANSIRAGWGEWVPEWLLNKITLWVKEELESKLNRSVKRKNELKGDK